MKKVSKYLVFGLILLSTTAIDSPNNEYKCNNQEYFFQSTNKMIEEISKLDSLEIRIDSLLNGKMEN